MGMIDEILNQLVLIILKTNDNNDVNQILFQ